MSLMELTNECILDLARVWRLAWQGLSLYKRGLSNRYTGPPREHGRYTVLNDENVFPGVEPSPLKLFVLENGFDQPPGFDQFGFEFASEEVRRGASWLGSRVSGFGFWVSGLGSRVSGFGSRVSGLGFRVSGLGFRTSRARRNSRAKHAPKRISLHPESNP